MRDGGPWKNNKWRREGSDPVQVTCRNVQDGYAIRDYVLCSCQMCEARNRSVHVAVESQHKISSVDMQSRVKYGLSGRYGLVDEVYPLPSKEPGRFIVRFNNPSSVAEALTMGGGNMPEHALSVTFTPAMRSKWTLSEQAPTRVTSSQAIDQHPSSVPFSPYPFGIVVPGNTPGVAAAHQIPPGMLHPSVANPANARMWPKTGGQQAFSGFAQPMPRLPDFVSAVRSYSQNQTFVPGPTHLETAGQAVDEPLQTKPPAEEALEDMHRNDRCGSYSPGSDGNGTTGTKARVSLPNTPSKASPKEVHTTQPTAAEKVADNQASEGVVPRLTHTTSVPGSSVTSHNWVPSVFTKNEIKERRQAWAKIPMPLNHRCSRNFTPTKPSSGPIKDGDNSRVSKGDKREMYAAESELSTPTKNVTFTPDTGSVYEQSPGKPVSPTCAPKDSSAPNSTGPTGQETIIEENEDRDRELATTSSQIGKTGCQSELDQTQALKPIEQDTQPEVFDTNRRLDNGQANQPKGKGKGPKSKSKKKKSKHKMMSQDHESNSHTLNSHTATQASRGDSESTHHGLSSTIGPDNQPSESFSPTKRQHDDPEQRSASDLSKRSKKHGNNQEISHDESDSPDEDARGRKGFRVGRGGSLRMGKTRRPRAIMTVAALAEQPTDTQTPPPSSDFAFQCQSSSASTSSPSLHGPDNSAMSRLNPKAQEFVSPSRVTLNDKQITPETDGIENFDRLISEDETNRTRNAIQEPLKSGLGAAPTDDSMLSEVATSAPKHRRALSEAAQKETLANDKEGACQGHAKTPGKGPKRAKGKERAATLGARKETAEGTEDATQDSPRTPKQPVTKTRKPGLINDDWPSLPASRDRAPSKPQTPSIWGAKTKAAVENGGLEQGSPVT